MTFKPSRKAALAYLSRLKAETEAVKPVSNVDN